MGRVAQRIRHIAFSRLDALPGGYIPTRYISLPSSPCYMRSCIPTDKSVGYCHEIPTGYTASKGNTAPLCYWSGHALVTFPISSFYPSMPGSVIFRVEISLSLLPSGESNKRSCEKSIPETRSKHIVSVIFMTWILTGIKLSNIWRWRMFFYGSPYIGGKLWTNSYKLLAVSY